MSAVARSRTLTGSDNVLTVVLVTEQVIAPSFIKPLVNAQEILGSFVQICCKISGSLPISVEWQKDGRKISSGVKYKLIQQDNSVSLEMEQLEVSDAGSYSCKLSNAAGSCECSGALTVKGQLPQRRRSRKRRRATP